MPPPKHLKSSSYDDHAPNHVALIPGLPDHLSHLCLSTLPPSLLFSTSRTWRRLLYSPSFPPFPSLYIISSSQSNSNSIHFSSFDPISSIWSLLPPPPNLPPLLLSHSSFISRPFPLQSSSTSSHLLLLSATSPSLSPALSSPLIFHPLSSSWLPSPPPIPSSPRRWCALGSSSSSLFLASGVASDYSADIARSFHRFDLASFTWETLPPLKDGRFSREPIKIVASQNKLCMVNSAREGAVYDIGIGEWIEMPSGLLEGWNGAVAAEGERIYVVEEGGRLKRYEWEEGRWTVVMEWEELKGAVAMEGGGGRVCVMCEGKEEEVKVVDVVGKSVWTVVVPEGRKVLAMHVLPRMPKSES